VWIVSDTESRKVRREIEEQTILGSRLLGVSFVNADFPYAPLEEH
jgi:hypothetical protein